MGSSITKRGVLTLAGRITVAIAVVLFPMVAALVLSLGLFSSASNRFDRVTTTAATQTVPMYDLYGDIGKSTATAFSVITRTKPASTLDEAQGTIDELFASVLAEDLPGGIRHTLLSAQRHWVMAKAAVAALVATPPLARSQLNGNYIRHIEIAYTKLDGAADESQGALAAEARTASSEKDNAIAGAVLATLAAMIIGLMLSLRLGRWIVEPLKKLRDGAERLGEGHLSHRIHLDRDDELGDVAHSFDAMAGALERAARRAPAPRVARRADRTPQPDAARGWGAHQAARPSRRHCRASRWRRVRSAARGPDRRAGRGDRRPADPGARRAVPDRGRRRDARCEHRHRVESHRR